MPDCGRADTCNGHGNCSTVTPGTCVCDEGWLPPFCSGCASNYFPPTWLDAIQVARSKAFGILLAASTVKLMQIVLVMALAPLQETVNAMRAFKLLTAQIVSLGGGVQTALVSPGIY